MEEKLKQIPGKVLGWWKKFSVKQKALLISCMAVVIVAFVILGVVLSASEMVILKECENTKEASEVQKILKDNQIPYEVTNDGLVFSVDEKDEANATILLGENNITAYAYEWENLNNVFSGGFSSTEADKSKKYQLWMENDLEEKLKTLAVIEDAQVTLKVPNQDGTLISKDEESYAWVILELNGEMEEATAQGLGRAIATALGNESTNNITILDSVGNMLFAGGETDTSVGTANSNLEIKERTQNQVANQVRDVVMQTNMYDGVSVALNLDIEYTETEVTDHLVYPAEGHDQGLLTEERDYESSSIGGVTGVPGTDSNDGTSYVTEDDGYTESNIAESEKVWQNSEKITNQKISMGRPNYENSSVAVVASNIRIYSEKTMRQTGQLEGKTFDEFKEANSERVKLEVDPEMITMVSKATGIPEENISMVAYEVPMFQYDSEAGKEVMDYLPIILAALIMLMLGYVVFRSTRKEKEPVVIEPELSVESLLESTREAQESLEDIGFSDKSEARVLIEKFVEENPEAAASLLRNWLNEEWE